jgi:hypothetical protein
VVIGDLSKNVYATYRGCRNNGLNVVGIADGNPAFGGLVYRRAPVMAPSTRLCGVDGIVVSNINPAQVDGRVEELRGFFKGPILRLWEPRMIGRAGLAA